MSARQFFNGIYYYCEVTPEQNMLDIHLTEIKNGLEIYIRRVPEAETLREPNTSRWRGVCDPGHI
jgi:hypothetical protein